MPESKELQESIETIDEEDLDETGVVSNPDQDLTGSQLENYIDDIADTVRVGLDQSISILTPWFFNNMPQIYYQTTPRQEKVRHLSAIITGHVFETKQTVELWDRDRSKVTYIGPGGDRQILLDMATKIRTHQIKMGGVYFSRDRLLFLSTFFSSNPKALDRSNQRIVDKVDAARKLMEREFPDSSEDIDRYIQNLDNDFVMYATHSRLSITYRMVRHMLNHEGSHTFLEPFENSSAARLTLGFKNINPAEIIESVLHLVYRYDFAVGRAFMVRFEEGYEEGISVMHFILTHDSKDKITREFVPMIRLIKALRTLGWVDNDEYSVFTRKPYHFSINAANLIRSMATWCHLFLSKRTPYAYSLYRIRNTFFHFPEITNQVVDLFRLKFDPMGNERRQAGEYEKALKDVETQIAGLVEDIDRAIFRECISFINNCVKTNYFMATKTGHAFRMGPGALDKKYYAEAPYGFYFISGRNFRAFHVRWKDVARGGMRVVIPRNNADYEYALSGLFDEVYGLSYAQQLKNKDIPEGGSKAVLVLKPGGHRDQAVKACVNALLDLLVEHDESHESVSANVSYFDQNEIIYLGPDENITNELINWMPKQAKRRHYKYWAAFMSSKPGAGINHKEYGVTSEGVNVFVENALNYLGINPREQEFTVKMTGGPDGDVAGNELKILHREYGNNAKVVAIADGFGCAFDTAGLDWAELLRLVETGKPITYFDESKLKSSDARVIKADNNTNIKIRNEIYFKIDADVFIPAGGRPYSVNSKNWKQFLNEDGKPSLRAVVEGANIFFTTKAREALQEAGVLIVKDSSANKTGVICSSFEIIASLTLSEEEFTAIKERYVAEVIHILRNKADAEAKLLFRELAKGTAKNTVELSLYISKEINGLTDVLLDVYSGEAEKILAEPLSQEIVLRHCPMVLKEKYHDRVFMSLPEAHQIAIISSFVASYIVYREGLGWLRTFPKSEWPRVMKTYMEKDRLSYELRQAVEKSDIGDKDNLSAILSRSAARDLTVMSMQKS